MPFTKVASNTYESPSGRQFNGAQVRLWYAQGGKFPGEKGPGEIKKVPKPKLLTAIAPRVKKVQVKKVQVEAPHISYKSPAAQTLLGYRKTSKQILFGR